MDPEEFLAYIDSLPPSVQQSMMQYIMAGGDPNMGGTAPFGAGPMNTGRLGGQMQGPLGVSPYDPMSAGAAYAYTPQLDTKGREQPFDLGTAQQNLNYVQDAQGNLFNNAFMMQGGEGVYAPGTFDPLPQAPGEYDMLVQSAMGYGPTTYQGFIAERIAKGEAPDIALSNFWAVANDPQNPASAQLLASLPPKYVQQENPMDPNSPPRMVQVEGGDMQKPQEFVQQLTEAQMKQGPQAPEYGAVAQDYIDKGIPFPTERYGEGQYSMESQFPSTWGAGGMSAITQAQQRLEEARAAADPRVIQQAQAKYLSGVEAPSASPGAQSRSWEDRGMTPQRGGWADDLERLTQNPLAQIGSAVSADVGGAGRRIEGIFDPNKRSVETTGKLGPSITGGVSPQGSGPVFAQYLSDMAPRVSARSAANRSVEGAQRQLAATQEQVWNKPARDAYARNLAMNKLGRTPTQDTLMARQLVNYMMGAYGPRG